MEKAPGTVKVDLQELQMCPSPRKELNKPVQQVH